MRRLSNFYSIMVIPPTQNHLIYDVSLSFCGSGEYERNVSFWTRQKGFNKPWAYNRKLVKNPTFSTDNKTFINDIQQFCENFINNHPNTQLVLQGDMNEKNIFRKIDVSAFDHLFSRYYEL